MTHQLTLLLTLALALPAPAAEPLRVAAWDVDLERGAPGLLLAELREAQPGPQVAAIVRVIQAVRPAVLLLTGVDDDADGLALAALADRLGDGPGAIAYPHRFRAPVNAGVSSGLDLDGDGRTGQAGDALGWGRFPGQGGMALLAQLPLDAGAVRSFTELPWRALPEADLPTLPDGTAFPDAARQSALRLSSRAHWDLPLVLPDGGRLHLLAANPTPPLSDGPAGVNRRRNADELRFWAAYLAGTAFADDRGQSAAGPDAPLVLLGNLNLDPADGAGIHAAMTALLTHPRLQDPAPRSAGAAAAGALGVNAGQAGDPALDTADWRDIDGPGNLRVDYVLPARGLKVSGAGVVWPLPGDALAAAVDAASPHRLVWVDLVLP